LRTFLFFSQRRKDAKGLGLLKSFFRKYFSLLCVSARAFLAFT